MRISYCDLCGCPIKNEKIRLIIAEYREYPEANFDTEENGQAYYMKKGFMKDKEVEICIVCKGIIDEIFKKRMIGVLGLAEDLKTIYELPKKYEKKSQKKIENQDS